ncbi:MAG TPA: hypothetical protein VFW84_09210 [Aquabacterium sp.]|uniref:methyltransferase family protein n=1 Tax=Aquabacterium sp. TaxID=1872578 RepID=UPI002E307953|nr:hypothetical protein [Aquabacterium sp.]HEX5372899.1 hypothetical protein [Aquabacterium sp.]
MPLLFLAMCWLLFGASHSLLAGHTLERLFGQRSRLAFNLIALVSVALPISIWLYLPAQPLWSEPPAWRWVHHGVSLLAGLGFVHTLRYYSLPGFLGLRAETWPLTFSPWHRWVRHPWYFLMLVAIWAQPMTDTWLVSALCITAYLIIGSRIEEQRILRYHPGAYAAYRRLVPGLLPWKGCALDNTTRRQLETQAARESDPALT